VTKRGWGAMLLAFALVALVGLWRPWRTRLRVISAGGPGPPDMMLLHGYGSDAESWLPFTKTIVFPKQGRFLIPEGPELMKRTDAVLVGRAWWDLDLAAHRRQGRPGVDLTQEEPRGLVRAAELVRRSLVAEGDSSSRRFVLGGFSQGAMVACEVAFGSDVPLAALVVLSGAPVDTTGWRTKMARRKGLRVFMSHGRADDVLPFDLAERLHAELVAAGLAVTFVPFEGGHEMPGEVVVALGQFLTELER
jgi:phospholipase/carboxylesterase